VEQRFDPASETPITTWPPPDPYNPLPNFFRPPITMSKPRADGRIAGEEYELLEPFQPDDEPLLPRYEIKPGPNVTSPNQRHELAKRHSAFRRSLSCLCLGLIIAVPSLALAACYFGRTTLERVRSWEQVPEEVKEWLDKVVPGGLGPDHAAFPIEYVPTFLY
jgi:hypothetical protein